ncbi:hypothetical protein J2Z40_002294 [Cytobacillus eiseniae]|uniref:Uncharacterized protein n=2 Tax=Cytobacillus TaxID=2675230 RepID=A0ABS4RFP0_9BACI|nr:hypothetical protein [Cytobacillus eiseniae]MBP2241722.1 hypothetical protein [Cytobacillus eiseniae]
MGDIATKKTLTLENLEVACDKFDPYIKSIRESIPKVGEDDVHFEHDLNKKKWKKAYVIAKEVFSWRSLIIFPVTGLIWWFFSIDILFGFIILSFVLTVIVLFLINYVLKIKTLFDMTDESKKDFFHFRAYANHRREYDVFAHFLINGNVFRFKQALELFKDWDKEIEKKDEMILKFEKDLKKMANDSVRLPAEAEQEIEFVNSLSEKLLEKIRRKTEGVLSFSTMELVGKYAIYRLEQEQLIIEYASVVSKSIPKTVDLDDKEMKNRSFIKILESIYDWETDNHSTISFVVELNGVIYVYTVIINERNKHALNPQSSSGKMNIDRLADVVSTAFKLYEYNTSKKKRG